MKLSLLSFPTIPDIIFRRLSTRGLCEAAAVNGLIGLDMMVGEVKLHGVKKLAKILPEYGLDLTCLIAHVPMTEFDAKRVTKKTEEALRISSLLRCRDIMIVPMGQFEAGRLKPRDKERIFRSYVRGFSLARGLCEKDGVRLSFEDTPTCLLPLSGTEECARLLGEIPGLGLVYDTANMLPYGSDPIGFYEKLKDRVTHVHLKDVDYVPNGHDLCSDGRYIKCCDFGRGVVDVKAIADMIAKERNATMAIEYTPPKKRDKTAHTGHIREFVDYLRG